MSHRYDDPLSIYEHWLLPPQRALWVATSLLSRVERLDITDCAQLSGPLAHRVSAEERSGS